MAQEYGGGKGGDRVPVNSAYFRDTPLNHEEVITH